MDGSLLESRVPLPGGWLIGDGVADWRHYRSAMLRPLTGYEEEWLARHNGVPNAIRTSHILDACVLRLDGQEPPRDMARRLLVGDRDFLVLQLRRLMHGDRILAVVACPECKSRMDVDLNASEIPVESGVLNDPTHQIELAGYDGHGGRVIRFRLPSGGDQEAVLGLDLEAATDRLLDLCLLDHAAIALGPEEKASLIAALEEHAPRLEPELELACPECGHSFVMPFDPTAFFFEELRISAERLLREVHVLAFYYHWSESEILGLERDRRRAYLALLSDTLRQES